MTGTLRRRLHSRAAFSCSGCSGEGGTHRVAAPVRRDRKGQPRSGQRFRRWRWSHRPRLLRRFLRSSRRRLLLDAGPARQTRTHALDLAVRRCCVRPRTASRSRPSRPGPDPTVWSTSPPQAAQPVPSTAPEPGIGANDHAGFQCKRPVQKASATVQHLAPEPGLVLPAPTATQVDSLDHAFQSTRR